MNEIRFETLTEKDTDPFLHNETAVRLFTETGGWFTGIFRRIKLENDCCRLGVDPFIRFGHKDPMNPRDPGSILLTNNDRPIMGSLQDSQLPFLLENPKRIIHDDIETETLIIGFSSGAAILSRRPHDVEEVHKMIRLVESFTV